MKIAFLNPWRDRAENQTFPSQAAAAARIGHQLVHCSNSMEVEACAPDFVLALSPLQPKLNDIPHYAVVHSPRDVFLTLRPHYDGILTCDGFLTISDTLARFVGDLMFAAGRPREIGFYFCTPQRQEISSDLARLLTSSRLKITHFGTNWDRRRCEIVSLLAEHDSVAVYGPESSWTGLPRQSYCGTAPFDGQSVQMKYAENGIGLCLLSDEHYRDDVISNRIFEVASVGAIAICPDIPWVRKYFGDSVYYIDQWLPDRYLVRQVLLRLEQIYRDPALAVEKARRAREIFEQQFAAERLLGNAVEYHRRMCARRQSALSAAAPHAPLISVIIRCGSRPLETIRRAVDSVAAQTYGRFDIILVRHRELDLSAITGLKLPHVESICVIDAPAGARSASLWAGLDAVCGEYFAVLDDDDWLFSNHFETLFRSPENGPPERYFAYSGIVQSEPQASPLPMGNRERRRMMHFGITSTEDLFAISEAFTPHSFVASSNLLHDALLQDPGLYTPEDTYLILSLLAQIDPKFSYAATAVYECGRADQSGFATHPMRFEDELTIQVRLHGQVIPRPSLASGYAALSAFWKRRPMAQAPSRDHASLLARLPAELIACVASGFDISRSNIGPGSTVVDGKSGECLIETPLDPWAYACELAPTIPSGRAGHGFFRIEALVKSGPIGVGILNPAEKDFLIRVPLQASDEPQLVYLPVEDMRQIGRIVMQNWDAPGAHSLHLRSLALWSESLPGRD